MVHGVQTRTPRALIESALSFHNSFLLSWKTSFHMVEIQQPVDVAWRGSRIQQRVLRLNYIASVHLDADFIGIHGVPRNAEGYIVVAYACRPCWPPKDAEASSLLYGLSFRGSEWF